MMNATTQGDSSFMEQRLNRNIIGKDKPDQRPISNDNNKNYSIFQP